MFRRRSASNEDDVRLVERVRAELFPLGPVGRFFDRLFELLPRRFVATTRGAAWDADLALRDFEVRVRRLLRPTGGWEAGWYYVEVAFHRRARSLAARLYVGDLGAPRREESILLPSNLRGSVRHAFRLEKPVAVLWWSAADSHEAVDQTDFAIWRISAFEAWLRVISRFAFEFVRIVVERRVQVFVESLRGPGLYGWYEAIGAYRVQRNLLLASRRGRDRLALSSRAGNSAASYVQSLQIARARTAQERALWSSLACRMHIHRFGADGSSVGPASFLTWAGRAKDEVALIVVGGVVLCEGAEARFAEALSETKACFAYADHDVETDAGRHAEPRFKPAYSPEYLRHKPYVGQVLGISAEMLARMDLAAFAARVEAEGVRGLAAELLKYAGDGHEHRVVRIPEVLYHVRGEDDSTRVHPARRPIVEGSWPRVSVLIPTRDRVELTRACIESIEAKSTYPRERLEIVLIDNDSTDAAALRYFDELSRKSNHLVVRAPGAFNFSTINNTGVAASSGEVLVFLNNDTTVIEPEWLEELVAYAAQDEIGVVGCKLLYPDGTIQHGGTVLGVQGVGAHHRVGQRNEEATDDCTREMSAVTGACFAVRRKVFEEVGGFDPVLAVAFNDVKLCATVMKAGYRNLYVGKALMHHHESKSRGFDDSPEKAARNRREATYVRRLYPELFQDDPYYSPNLSLQEVGEMALPPRELGRWRRREPGQNGHVLLLSSTHRLGHGVPCVLREQALHLRAAGWRVSVGGPKGEREFDYPDCDRVELVDPEDAATYAVREGVDAIVAHTPPFYSVVRWLGRWPLVYVMDHGEPPAELFDDRDARELVNGEKWFCAALAKGVFAISEAVKNQGFEARAKVLRNGNTHLSKWTERSEGVRLRARERFCFEDKLVVLNVCRFEEQERLYKGVDRYAEVAQETPYLSPELAGRVEFVLAGKGSERDVEAMKRAGLRVFANVSDAELVELYAAADVYMNFSKWEGYNLGIGQALAMGLEVIASDIEAHREFPISLTNDVVVAARMLREKSEHPRERNAICFDWAEPICALEAALASDRSSSAL